MFEFLSNTNRRAHRSEWLDDPLVPPGSLFKSLRAVGRINRLTGGLATSMAGIRSLFESDHDDQKLRVLDIGTGDGSFLFTLDRWANRHGIELKATGLELRRPVVAQLRQRFRRRDHIQIRCDDLFELQGTAQFDITHASLVLHHFDDASVTAALQTMQRLADVGVVINDLHRHPLAHAGSHLLVRALTRDRMAHRDGPLSVRRGFKRGELADACRRAGLDDACVAWRWPFRWLVTARLSSN